MPSKPLTEEQKQALQTLGSLGAFTAAVPFGTILPFQNLLNEKDKLNIKQQEAMRMFPQADPNMFDVSRTGNQSLPIVPLHQGVASSRVFDKDVRKGDSTTGSPLYPDNLYKGQKSFPSYLSGQPEAPSPELGSYSQVVQNKTIFPEGDIQAITVTPGPNPGRFAQDYAEILSDKLGKAINQFEGSKEWNDEAAKLASKINVLSSKIPGQTAGYVWGNTDQPQYTYAEGNWGQGQKLTGDNPSIYVSRINADPSKEAEYLYTGNIKKSSFNSLSVDNEKDYLSVDPRAKFKLYEDLGPGTGPSWGITDSRGNAGDIHFRKDLIGARGELTVGDLQSLLAERNLPFTYQTYTKTPDKTVAGSSGTGAIIQGARNPIKKPGNLLDENLQRLADAEGISPSQAIEKFARLVPNVGEPVTPPTPAVTGQIGKFPIEGQTTNPFGSFASKTDLRQIGILPPVDKTRYSPFTVDEFDTTFKHVYPRYNASAIERINPHTRIIETMLAKGTEEAQKEFAENINNPSYDLIINRDALRPQAANKLLNRTVENLVEQSKPIKGLGLGGFAAGSIATAMDPAVVDALSRGNYMQAGTTAALNTAIGSAVGGATAKGLQALQAAGYARPAAAVGSALPLAGGLLAGQGLVETGKALNRVYKSRSGKDFATRNQVPSSYPTYAGSTPTIQPRMGTAILGGKPVQVPYGSVAGTKTVGRPWWDVVGSKFEDALNRFNAGSIIGR